MVTIEHVAPDLRKRWAGSRGMVYDYRENVVSAREFHEIKLTGSGLEEIGVSVELRPEMTENAVKRRFTLTLVIYSG